MSPHFLKFEHRVSMCLQKSEMSPLVEGTLAALSEVLEFHGDHAHIYNMGWKKKKSDL